MAKLFFIFLRRKISVPQWRDKDFYNKEKTEKNKSDGGIYFVIVTKLKLKSGKVNCL